MKFPVFDLHCDTAEAMVLHKENRNLRNNTLHIDMERASKLPGYCQCFACFTTSDSDFYHIGVSPVQMFEREIAVLHSEIEKNSDVIRIAYSAEEINENLKNGLMSAVLTIEGPAGFDFDVDLLEDMYKVGFRISTLGWNEKNVLTGSHKTGGGLSDVGRAYVKEAQRLGILIDVSHISDEGFWDIMEITQAPVIASHSNSRKVCGESRNITDDMFREICRTGGTVGLNLYAEFVGKNANLDSYCDHVFHFLEMDPDAAHISLGGDLDGCDLLPSGFEGIQDYPKIAQRLLERGLNERMVANIFWNNAVGVIDRCSI